MSKNECCKRHQCDEQRCHGAQKLRRAESKLSKLRLFSFHCLRAYRINTNATPP